MNPYIGDRELDPPEDDFSCCPACHLDMDEIDGPMCPACGHQFCDADPGEPNDYPEP